jgi:hypothetical protein
MAPRQLGSFRVSRAERGMGEMDDVLLWRAYLGFGLKMPALARVTMGCCCGGGAAAAGAGDGALTGRHAGGEWVAGGAREWFWGGGDASKRIGVETLSGGVACCWYANKRCGAGMVWGAGSGVAE